MRNLVGTKIKGYLITNYFRKHNVYYAVKNGIVYLYDGSTFKTTDTLPYGMPCRKVDFVAEVFGVSFNSILMPYDKLSLLTGATLRIQNGYVYYFNDKYPNGVPFAWVLLNKFGVEIKYKNRSPLDLRTSNIDVIPIAVKSPKMGSTLNGYTILNYIEAVNGYYAIKDTNYYIYKDGCFEPVRDGTYGMPYRGIDADTVMLYGWKGFTVKIDRMYLPAVINGCLYINNGKVSFGDLKNRTRFALTRKLFGYNEKAYVKYRDKDIFNCCMSNIIMKVK